MKIIFMGTPDFSVPCLKKLCLEGHDVAAVFTQPDKPKGRGHKMLPPPVKQAAEELGIEVFQPVSLKKGEDAEKSLEIIKNISPIPYNLHLFHKCIHFISCYITNSTALYGNITTI